MPSVLTLNGLDLPKGLVWLERGSWQPVTQASERFMGGREHIEYGALVAGMPITLSYAQVSSGVQGAMVQALADQIEALARVPGATYALNLAGTIYTVIFRHEEPPAFSYEPLIKRLSPGAGDYVLPVIKLKTV